MSCASNEGRVRSLLCFQRESGAQLWQQDVEYADEEPSHPNNPYCSSSPVTDGERVIVWHGSAGLHAYDVDGAKLWNRDLGKFQHIWGNGSSPILYRDLVILNAGPGLQRLRGRSGQADGRGSLAARLSRHGFAEGR